MPDVTAYTILVAADAAGGIHLAWLEGQQYYDTQVYYRHWSNGQWGPPEPILPNNTTYGQYLDLLGLEVAANGQPQVLLGWDQKLILAERTGAAWSTTIIRNVGTHSTAYGTLTLDASGVPHVVYADRASNGTYNVFYMTRDAGGRWSTPLDLYTIPVRLRRQAGLRPSRQPPRHLAGRAGRRDKLDRRPGLRRPGGHRTGGEYVARSGRHHPAGHGPPDTVVPPTVRLARWS